eukprot:s5547_g5.t1
MQSNRLNDHITKYDNEVNMLEEYIDVVRFGLVEYGGFVRHSSLTTQQRSSMMTQERANALLFDMKQRAPENTDPPTSAAPLAYGGRPSASAGPSSSSALPGPPTTESAIPMEVTPAAGEEDAEEESPTIDSMEEDGGDEGPLTKLTNNLRDMQNEALASERFADASELQTGVMAVLQAASDGTKMSTELVTAVQNCMQRPYRSSRNRGEGWLSEVYKAYADDFRLLLQ